MLNRNCEIKITTFKKKVFKFNLLIKKLIKVLDCTFYSSANS